MLEVGFLLLFELLLSLLDILYHLRVLLLLLDPVSLSLVFDLKIAFGAIPAAWQWFQDFLWRYWGLRRRWLANWLLEGLWVAKDYLLLVEDSMRELFLERVLL